MTTQQYPWHNAPHTHPKWCLEARLDARDGDLEYRLIHAMAHPPSRSVSLLHYLSIRLVQWLAARK